MDATGIDVALFSLHPPQISVISMTPMFFFQYPGSTRDSWPFKGLCFSSDLKPGVNFVTSIWANQVPNGRRWYMICKLVCLGCFWWFHFNYITWLMVSTQLKNMIVKMGIFPRYRGENKKCLKPPSSFGGFISTITITDYFYNMEIINFPNHGTNMRRFSSFSWAAMARKPGVFNFLTKRDRGTKGGQTLNGIGIPLSVGILPRKGVPFFGSFVESPWFVRIPINQSVPIYSICSN